VITKNDNHNRFYASVIVPKTEFVDQNTFASFCLLNGTIAKPIQFFCRKMAFMPLSGLNTINKSAFGISDCYLRFDCGLIAP